VANFGNFILNKLGVSQRGQYLPHDGSTSEFLGTVAAKKFALLDDWGSEVLTISTFAGDRSHSDPNQHYLGRTGIYVKPRGGVAEIVVGMENKQSAIRISNYPSNANPKDAPTMLIEVLGDDGECLIRISAGKWGSPSIEMCNPGGNPTVTIDDAGMRATNAEDRRQTEVSGDGVAVTKLGADGTELSESKEYFPRSPFDWDMDDDEEES
jgi:hypothetical protein